MFGASLVAIWLVVAGVVVETTSDCPSADMVNARFQELLPADSLSTSGDTAWVAETNQDQLRLRLTRADGTLVGERLLDRAVGCQELARVAAVALAAWLSDVHPDFAAGAGEASPGAPALTAAPARNSGRWDVAVGGTVALPAGSSDPCHVGGGRVVARSGGPRPARNRGPVGRPEREVGPVGASDVGSACRDGGRLDAVVVADHRGRSSGGTGGRAFHGARGRIWTESQQPDAPRRGKYRAENLATLWKLGPVGRRSGGGVAATAAVAGQPWRRRTNAARLRHLRGRWPTAGVWADVRSASFEARSRTASCPMCPHAASACHQCPMWPIG